MSTGSGKSTLAKELAKERCWLHYEADMFFIDKNGVYRFDPMRLKEAHNWCQRSVRTALRLGVPVIVSNTFVKRWEMKAYLDMYPDAIVFTCEGNYGSVHGVPEDAMHRMKASWEELA